jgi:hypothetical protein
VSSNGIKGLAKDKTFGIRFLSSNHVIKKIQVIFYDPKLCSDFCSKINSFIMCQDISTTTTTTTFSGNSVVVDTLEEDNNNNNATQEYQSCIMNRILDSVIDPKCYLPDFESEQDIEMWIQLTIKDESFIDYVKKINSILNKQMLC